MYKHTGNYPYNCEYCNKGFAGRSQYRYHVLRHSGQSPYICKECGGRFWKKRNLEVHCSRHRCDNAPAGLQKCAVRCISILWCFAWLFYFMEIANYFYFTCQSPYLCFRKQHLLSICNFQRKATIKTLIGIGESYSPTIHYLCL